MTRVKRARADITDELSPDFSTCENCGEPIGWGDYSYTHMSNGMATCGTTISGGVRLGLVTLNPTITQDRDVTTNAEPVEWFEDA